MRPYDVLAFDFNNIRVTLWADRPATTDKLPEPASIPVTIATPPAIGDPLAGGIYAGITIHDNAAMRLVLLPGDFEGDWDAAGRWAKDQGGELPSRIDQLVLWQNLRREFQQTYYWSAEQYAPDAGYAWCQYFYDGSQHASLTSAELRARAVRRLPL